MVSIQSPLQLSLAEFLQQPETKPASEYIDGKIYQKPMPKKLPLKFIIEEKAKRGITISMKLERRSHYPASRSNLPLNAPTPNSNELNASLTPCA
jgi:hypothetical protein